MVEGGQRASVGLEALVTRRSSQQWLILNFYFMTILIRRLYNYASKSVLLYLEVTELGHQLVLS